MRAPTKPDASMAIVFVVVSSSQLSMSRRRTRCVIVQNRNKIHVADKRALMVFTIRATSEGSLTNWVNRLAVSIKNGAPGG